MFEERKRYFVEALGSIAKAGVLLEEGEDFSHTPCQPSEAFEEFDELPDFLLVSRDSMARSEGDVRMYQWDIFKDRGVEIVGEDLSEEEVREKLRVSEESEMPRGLPSDGGKGQWKAAKAANVKTYKWFLGELE